LSFVHLHTHSEFSLLDGANRIADLVRKAKEYEMPGLALTDHGCMFGAWTFHKVATKEGLKPIIGMEAYVAPGDRRDRLRPTIMNRDVVTLPGQAQDHGPAHHSDPDEPELHAIASRSCFATRAIIARAPCACYGNLPDLSASPEKPPTWSTLGY